MAEDTMRKPGYVLFGLLIVAGMITGQTGGQRSVASTLTTARSSDGKYISWREHLVDDEALGGVAIRGGDGLKMADLDKDGYLDVVSVHESDTQYDGALVGYIRIAFGSKDPDKWVLTTLASGKDAAAAEDVAIADINGDGYLDVGGACELAHLIYFQNPGKDARTRTWGVRGDSPETRLSTDFGVGAAFARLLIAVVSESLCHSD